MAASLPIIIAQLGALLFIGLVVQSVYRLFFSPLAKFPGPKLAALTSLYEGYYDCLKDGGGRYWAEITRMHEEYGPIVRINPWELHIRDPDWHEIYKISRRAYKPLWYYRFLGPPDNVFSTVSHEMHRARRDAIGPYFSPQAVARHQSTVDSLVRKLLGRLAEFKGTGKTVSLGDAFRALATDAATAFAFRRQFAHLDSDNFEHAANRAARKLGCVGLVNRHFRGWLLWVMRTAIPPWLALKLNPGSLGVAFFFRQLNIEVKRGFDSAEKFVERGEAETDLARQILNSNLPPEEKTIYRVTQEASAITLAGTETTGNIITVVVYHLLIQPKKLARLREELKGAYEVHGRPPTYQELKELPYLAGAVNEGLRLGGLAARLPRYDPKHDMVYKGLVIPKGTYVSTTQNDTHFSPEIFAMPHVFLPERWLDEADRKYLSKYHMPFGRGSRTCIGMEISLLEVYLCVARLFSPEVSLELELHDTDYETDIKMYHEYLSPFPKGDGAVKAFVK